MRAQRRRRFAPAALSCVLLLFFFSQLLIADAIVSGLSVSQTTWLDRDNVTPLESYSEWGHVTFAYTPDPIATNYLNISLAQPGQSPVWLAQNVPLFSDDLAGRLGIDVDLSLIGISSGTALTSAGLVYTVDPVIRTTDPLGLVTAVGVNELKWMGWSDDPVPGEPPAWPGSGRPGGTRNTTPATPQGNDRDIRPQQEGELECFLGATTRSLDWLNRTHFGLALKDAAGIYGDLKSLTVGQGEPKKIELKAKYASEKSGGSIVTKVQDTAGFFGGGIPGVPITKPNIQSIDDWLVDQFQTEDVELAIYNGAWAY